MCKKNYFQTSNPQCITKLFDEDTQKLQEDLLVIDPPLWRTMKSCKNSAWITRGSLSCYFCAGGWNGTCISVHGRDTSDFYLKMLRYLDEHGNPKVKLYPDSVEVAHSTHTVEFDFADISSVNDPTGWVQRFGEYGGNEAALWFHNGKWRTTCLQGFYREMMILLQDTEKEIDNA